MSSRFQDVGEGKVEGRKLDPRAIIIREDFNYRDVQSEHVQTHIAWLKENIRIHGVQQPIRVEYIAGKVYLIDGHCRVEACKQLFKEGFTIPYKDGGSGPPLIPALVVQGDEGEILAASMIANGALPPTKLEFGKGAAKLLALGWPREKIALYTPPHIAKNKKMAERYVEDAVELHHAPLEVKEALTKGVDGVEVSEGLALAATKHNRLHATETIRNEVAKAKAKGKKVAKRPKGEGKVTKAKQQEDAKLKKLLDLGDKMADNSLASHTSMDDMEKLAKQWNRARGR